MATPVEFLIKIAGGAAGELGKTSDGFDKTGKKGKEAAECVKVFEAEAGRLSSTIGGLQINLAALHDGGHLFTFDLAEGLHSAVELGAHLFEKVAEIGKEILHTVAKVEDLNFALKKNLGEEGAEAVDKLAESFERTTRFSASQTKAALLPLTEQGIKDIALLDQIGTASADLSARLNTGKEGFASYVGALGTIALKGGAKIKGQLKELQIKPAEYYQSLGELLHKSAKEAEALAKAGKVANESLLSTAVHVIALREGGEGIGVTAAESAATLGGVLDRLSNVPENLMERLLGSAGMTHVQGILEAILGELGGPGGTQLVERFAGAMDRAFSQVTAKDVVDAVSLIADTVGGIVAATGEAVRLAAELNRYMDKRAQRSADEQAGTVARVDLGGGKGLVYQQQDIDEAVTRRGVNWFERLVIPTGDLTRIGLTQLANERAAEEGHRLGEEYDRGLAAGILESRGLPEEAAASVASGVHKAASGPDGLDAHSPSRKGVQLGRYYVQGVAEGMRQESAGLEVAATRTVGQTATAAGAPGGGGGVRDVTVPIYVTGAGDPVATGQAVRREVRELLVEMGLGMGVAA